MRRLETTRSGLCPCVFVFSSPGGTRGLIFSASVFNFFEVLIVEFYIYTTLGHLVDVQGPPLRGGVPTRTLFSQISERQAEMFGVPEGAVKMPKQRLISLCTRKSEMDGQEGILSRNKTSLILINFLF